MEELQNNLYRYERKFVIATNRLNGLIGSLYSQNYLEHYPGRRINNIYYDAYSIDDVFQKH